MCVVYVCVLRVPITVWSLYDRPPVLLLDHSVVQPHRIATPRLEIATKSCVRYIPSGSPCINPVASALRVKYVRHVLISASSVDVRACSEIAIGQM